MNAVGLFDPDESAERALFERRARVRRAAPGVPSLEAVLREARDVPREGASNAARAWRAWRGFVLAAACLLAVVKARPMEGSAAKIAADVDGRSSPVADIGAGGTCDDQEVVRSCTLDSRTASLAPAGPAEQSSTCDGPPATFASSRMLSCDGANRSEIP